MLIFYIHEELEIDESLNNRELTDCRETQILSQKEIETLKIDSLTGELSSTELIKKILDNNTSFESKTGKFYNLIYYQLHPLNNVRIPVISYQIKAFAKQKYIKRKEKK
jgi:hypothetical protein